MDIPISLDIKEEYLKRKSDDILFPYSSFPILLSLGVYCKIESINDNWYVIQRYDEDIFGPIGVGVLPLNKYFDYEIIKKYNPSIISFPEKWRDFFSEKLGVDSFIMKGRGDYIYELEPLTLYEGKDYYTCRRYYNKFMNEYGKDFRIEILNEDNLHIALKVVYDWEVNYNRDIEFESELDLGESLIVLNNWRGLKDLMYGVVGFIKDKPVGVFMAFRLTNDTAVLYVSKCEKIQGLHRVLMKEISKLLLSKGYIYLNNTEGGDLDNNTGLNIIKKSYRPIRLEEKYFIPL